MSIYITGDTHGYIDRSKLTTGNFKIQKELNKNDYIIITGDAAIIWSSYTNGINKISGEDRNLIKWYNHKNFTTLFVDGNHENHDALNKYPIEIWNGGKIHRIADSVIHLMRGQIYTIDNKTFFVMGGAKSIDKMYRKENLTWWSSEMPSKKEYEEAIINLEKHNMTVDYIISHCCGTPFIKDLISDNIEPDELTQFFKHIEFDFNTNFKHWYFGHYHIDKQIDSKHTCIYNKIIKIED